MEGALILRAIAAAYGLSPHVDRQRGRDLSSRCLGQGT